jgi:membrane-associated protease RseP (regulator of RpoE activity)
VACRFYDVDCTLPFFLPAPFFAISGTLGAVIKIRERFPNRKALFDIGIAGPIAGFLVLCPILWLAVQASTVGPEVPPSPGTIYFGEPLLFRALTWLRFGDTSALQVNLHPAGFAAWFGMLATSLNLLPFGQFDGGHLAYAVLGERAKYVSLATVAGTLVMWYFSVSWIVLTIIMLVMMKIIGLRHPPVLNDYEPLGRERLILTAFAVLMFALCFMPIPAYVVSQ